MSVTIGKNADNGMISLTFDSTGRTVQLMPIESSDFEARMDVIKKVGRLHQGDIGRKAIYAIQLLGKAIENGDPEEISSLWLGTGKNIVESAILNGIIEEFDNLFELYVDKKHKETSIEVSMNVQKILDTLVFNLLQYISSKQNNGYEIKTIYMKAIKKIKLLYIHHVGLSDTASREAMFRYIKDKLKKNMTDKDAHDLSIRIWQEF